MSFLFQVVQYIGELCRYLLSQPHRPSENQHSVRLALGNGLRPQIWKEFQTRFGIKQIGEFYGSTEGTASIINIDSTPGACGFVSEIVPKLYPVVIFKVDPETGELVRGPDGLAVKTKAGEVGQIVGKSIKGTRTLVFLIGWLVRCLVGCFCSLLFYFLHQCIVQSLRFQQNDKRLPVRKLGIIISLIFAWAFFFTSRSMDCKNK